MHSALQIRGRGSPIVSVGIQTVYRFIYLSDYGPFIIHLFLCISVHLYVSYLPNHPSLSVSIILPLYPSVFFCWSICPAIYLTDHPSINHPINPSTSPPNQQLTIQPTKQLINQPNKHSSNEVKRRSSYFVAVCNFIDAIFWDGNARQIGLTVIRLARVFLLW